MKRPPRVAVQMDLQWPYKRHTEIYQGIQAYADEHGWTLVLDDFVARHGVDSERQHFPYDAVIGRIDACLAEQVVRWRIPAVNVWRGSPAVQLLPGVFPDTTAVGQLAAEHLLDRGFKQFAVLPCLHAGDQEAAAAFDDMVRQAGCECLHDAVHVDFCQSAEKYTASMLTIEHWINSWRPPSGVFVPSDAYSRMVVQACRLHGLQVPQDAAIVCGDDEEAFALRPRPSITGINLGYYKIGEAAAALLDELLTRPTHADEPPLPPRHIRLPPAGVVARESTDCLAIDDAVVAEAIAFIKSNANRDIGQQDVARAVAIEVRTLQARFRKVLDRPIAATIRMVRIDKARKELVAGDRPLAAIARDAGFGTSTRMNNAFRAELGITPHAYRRQWRDVRQAP